MYILCSLPFIILLKYCTHTCLLFYSVEIRVLDHNGFQMAIYQNKEHIFEEKHEIFLSRRLAGDSKISA